MKITEVFVNRDPNKLARDIDCSKDACPCRNKDLEGKESRSVLSTDLEKSNTT